MAKFETLTKDLVHKTNDIFLGQSVFPEIDWNKALIYHYCDVNALYGILSHSTLWATDFAYMNDPLEYLHGRKIIDDVYQEIRDLTKNETDKFLLDQLKAFIPQWDSTITNFSIVPGEMHPQHLCCCCFCLKSDKLSQWRAYASNGFGYAIGFELSKLQKCLEKEGRPRGEPVFIIYDKEKQEDTVADTILSTLQMIRSNMSEEEIKDDLNQILAFLCAKVSITATKFKHPKFAEEEEFRYVINEMTTGDRKFRTRNGMFIPYKELTPLSGGKLPIKEIIVGPCLDFPKAEFSLNLVLQEADYKDVKIIQSEIPYVP